MRKIITAVGVALALAGIPAVIGGAPAAARATSASDVHAGAAVTCAVAPGGELRCWGTNAAGQLGIADAVPRSTTPVATAIGPVARVAVGEGTHVCAVVTDGTAACWGGNGQGQLGDGTTVSRSLPAPVLAEEGSTDPLTGVREIVVGGEHTCAALLDGTARCWGNGTSGRLGDGTTVSRLAPVTVRASGTDPSPLQGVEQIAAGNSHACALLAGGTVKCWGNNGSGRLGDGTSTNRISPVNVRTSATVAAPLTGVVQIAAGAFHTCALLDAGGVRCWGQNVSSGAGTLAGQLGDGTTTSRTSPVEVVGLPGPAVQVTAGQSHTCALLEGGDVWCWGHNGNGRLGLGTVDTANHPTPQLALATGATQVTAGSSHTCVRSLVGSLRCWGGNAQGQLGDGTQADGGSPVWVADFEDPESSPSPSPDPDPEPTASPTPDPVPVETTMSLVILPSSAVAREQVRLVASIAPAPPDGEVAFSEDGAPLRGCATRPIDPETGEASCVVIARPRDLGSHRSEASFAGSEGYAPSSTEVDHVVVPKVTKVRALRVVDAGDPAAQVSFMVGTASGKPLSKRLSRALSRACAMRVSLAGPEAGWSCARFRPREKRFVAPVPIDGGAITTMAVSIETWLDGAMLTRWEGVVSIRG